MLTVLGMGLLRVLSWLPYQWLLHLGRGLGGLLMRVVPKRVSVVETNLRRCFPDWSDAQLQASVQDVFGNVGIGFFETALAWWGGEQRIRRMLTVEGLEHINALLDKKQGILLLCHHVTSLELAGRCLSFFMPACTMYREQNNKAFNRIMKRARERIYTHCFLKDNVRGVMRALRRGCAICYMADQNSPEDHTVFVPFFGIQTATLSATTTFAQFKNTAAVAVAFYRKASGGYVLAFEPVPAGFPSGDVDADATAVNAIYESRIRQHPTQYLWTHRRFKQRPDGEPAFYA